MGAEDVERQALNVYRMRLLGARVTAVEAGSRTLKDAINEALRDWVTHVRTTYYLLGSALGPHPYPLMVRDFHAVIGRETRRQARTTLGRLPDVLVACVGGGSNAIGLFHPFIGDRRVRLIGVEPGGEGIATGRHGASMTAGRIGVLHGCMSYLLQNDDGQIATAHSISAGLDYPGVGPGPGDSPAGDPSLGATERLVREAAARGADIVELGVPFSDPIADGPVIQRAAMRALERGISVARVLETVATLRAETAVPLVLLTYYNPVLAFGLKAFAQTAADAGVDGVIVADLPPEEADPFAAEAEAAGLDLVHLVAPTSTPPRVRLIARRSRGFIYVVSLTGVTGTT